MSKSAFEIEDMAQAAHEVWMEGKIRAGWVLSPVTNKDLKQHSCLVPYSELSEADKESDRDLVRGIPDILKRAGYEIRRAENARQCEMVGCMILGQHVHKIEGPAQAKDGHEG